MTKLSRTVVVLAAFALMVSMIAAPTLEACGSCKCKATKIPVVKTEGDTEVINWHLPKDFDKALKICKKEKRLLMIRGQVFGVDCKGEKDATKGQW